MEMKKIILTATLVALTSTTTLCAIETETTKPSRSQSKQTKIELLELKITKYTKHLENLPIKIKEVLLELGDYEEKGNDAENMTRNLLQTLDGCVMNELDSMAEDACSDITATSVSKTIKDYKLEMKDMIKVVEAKLDELKKQKKNTPIIEGAIKALTDARDILKGTK